MNDQSQPTSRPRSFNLFDALVVGVLLVGLPLGYWTYSTGKRSLKSKAGGDVRWDIPGLDYASEAFRATVVNYRTRQTVMAKLVEGEVVYDQDRRTPVGVVREAVPLNDRCAMYRDKAGRFCPVKVVVDLRCVESNSSIRCLEKAVRIGDDYRFVTKFLIFNGEVIDIQKLRTLDVSQKPDDHSPKAAVKAPQKPSKKMSPKKKVVAEATKDMLRQKQGPQEFRVTLFKRETLQTVFDKIAEGDVVYDLSGHKSIGEIQGATLLKQCKPDKDIRRASIPLCPVKVVVDLRCVESENNISCLGKPTRIGSNVEYITKFYRFSGEVVDIQRLRIPETSVNRNALLESLEPK